MNLHSLKTSERVDFLRFFVRAARSNHVGAVALPPRSGAKPIYAGKWVNFGSSEVDIEVIVGDGGGILAAGLLIQQKFDLRDPNDPSFEVGEGGLPKLPLFLTGPLSEEERKLLSTCPMNR